MIHHPHLGFDVFFAPWSTNLRIRRIYNFLYQKNPRTCSQIPDLPIVLLKACIFCGLSLFKRVYVDILEEQRKNTTLYPTLLHRASLMWLPTMCLKKRVASNSVYKTAMFFSRCRASALVEAGIAERNVIQTFGWLYCWHILQLITNRWLKDVNLIESKILLFLKSCG